MKTLTEIAAEQRVAQHEKQAIEHKRTFETGLFTGLKVAFAEMLGTALRLVKKETYSVRVENQVKLPAVQKIDGVVSLKELKTLVLGLNEVVKSLKDMQAMHAEHSKMMTKELKPLPADFSPLERAVKAIKIPETIIPDYPTVIEVSNLKEVKKAVEDLGKKLKIEPPIVNVPPSPKTITVGNLDGLQTTLEGISSKLDQATEEPTGYSFQRDESGRLKSFTEHYSDGDIISTGWSLGRVKITDGRNRKD